MKKPSLSEHELEAAIMHVTLAMMQAEPASEEFKALVERLDTLYRLKEIDKTNNPPSVDVNTVIVVAANLFGIVLICNYEKAHVLTSKAMNFLTKAR